MELNASLLSLRKFGALMKTFEKNYDEPYLQTIERVSACSGVPVEDFDEIDLTELKELSLKLADLELQGINEQEPIQHWTHNGNTYSVRFLEDGSLNLKFNEHKYLRRILQDVANDSNVKYDNLHKIAAVLFKESEDKFNIEAVEARAELMRDNMTITYAFPYLKLILEKIS